MQNSWTREVDFLESNLLVEATFLLNGESSYKSSPGGNRVTGGVRYDQDGLARLVQESHESETRFQAKPCNGGVHISLKP
jgi:hypothetical protein